jgi:hypothetical protein
MKKPANENKPPVIYSKPAPKRAVLSVIGLGNKMWWCAYTKGGKGK